MTKHIQIWVRRQPVFAFYILAFIITWLAWIPQAAYSHGLFPIDSPLFYMLGGVGPLAAILIVARVLYGKKDGEEVFKPLLRWRVGIVWYIVAVCGSIVIMLASMGFRGELGHGVERITPSLAMLHAFQNTCLLLYRRRWHGADLPCPDFNPDTTP